MLIREAMTAHPPRIRSDSDLERAADLIALSGASDLMVVDEDNSFVGVLSEGDVLRAAMPDREEVLAEGGTMADAFALFVLKGGRLRDREIDPFVIRTPIVVSPDDHIGAAAAIMIDRMIRRLPVVENGKLIGTVSRADICRTVVGML